MEVPYTPPPPPRFVLVDQLDSDDVARFVARVGRLTAAAADQLAAGDDVQAISTLRVLSGVAGGMVDRLLGPKRCIY